MQYKIFFLTHIKNKNKNFNYQNIFSLSVINALLLSTINTNIQQFILGKIKNKRLVFY